MELPFSASDGRQLVRPVVSRLQGYGARVRQIGVYPTRDGLLFVAEINGRVVSVQTSAGTIPYTTVATDLLAATLLPRS